MITYLSNRHSKEKEEVPGNMWDMPELSIVQQTSKIKGDINPFVNYFGYLIYEEGSLLLGTQKIYPRYGSPKEYMPGLFKKSDPGTVLSLTQE